MIFTVYTLTVATQGSRSITFPCGRRSGRWRISRGWSGPWASCSCAGRAPSRWRRASSTAARKLAISCRSKLRKSLNSFSNEAVSVMAHRISSWRCCQSTAKASSLKMMLYCWQPSQIELPVPCLEEVFERLANDAFALPAADLPDECELLAVVVDEALAHGCPALAIPVCDGVRALCRCPHAGTPAAPPQLLRYASPTVALYVVGRVVSGLRRAAPCSCDTPTPP